MRTDIADVEKLENSLKAYSFLGWLNHFLKLRNDTRSNLSRPKNEDMGSNADDEDENMQVEQFSVDTGNLSDTDSNTSTISMKKKKKVSGENPSQSGSTSLNNFLRNRELQTVKYEKEKTNFLNEESSDTENDVLKNINNRLLEKS